MSLALDTLRSEQISAQRTSALYKGASLTVLAGLTCALLLPVGMNHGTMYLGLKGPVFQALFYFHLFVQILAVVYSLCASFALMAYAPRRFIWALGMTLAIAVIIFSLAIVPPFSRDALIHHLVVPKWWLEAGIINEIRWHEWSYYPMLADLPFIGLLNLNLEWACALYHSSFLFLGASLVALFVGSEIVKGDTIKRWLVPYSFILTISLPICIRLATEPLVDLPLMLYTGLGLISLIMWGESKAPGWATRRWLVIAGISLGLALSTKYNGFLAVAILLLLFIPYATQKRGSFKIALVDIFFVSLIALVVLSPWLIKNIMWTSNPIYPLMKGYFGDLAHGRGLPSLPPIAQRAAIYNENWYQILLLPVRIIVGGVDDNPRLFDGKLSPLLLLAPIAFLYAKRRSWTNFVLNFSVLYLLAAVILSTARVRYLAPIFMPGVILTVIGLLILSESHKGYGRSIVTALFSLHLLLTAIYCNELLTKVSPFDYLLSRESRTEFLNRKVPSYNLITYINQHLPASSTVMLLYPGNFFYYYQVQVRGEHNSIAPIVRLLDTTKNAKSMANELKLQGVTHLFCHTQRTLEALQSSLKEDEAAIWQDFATNHLKAIYQDQYYSLFEIKS